MTVNTIKRTEETVDSAILIMEQFLELVKYLKGKHPKILDEWKKEMAL